jgi:hypothetical protein
MNNDSGKLYDEATKTFIVEKEGLNDNLFDGQYYDGSRIKDYRIGARVKVTEKTLSVYTFFVFKFFEVPLNEINSFSNVLEVKKVFRNSARYFVRIKYQGNKSACFFFTFRDNAEKLVNVFREKLNVKEQEIDLRQISKEKTDKKKSLFSKLIGYFILSVFVLAIIDLFFINDKGTKARVESYKNLFLYLYVLFAVIFTAIILYSFAKRKLKR